MIYVLITVFMITLYYSSKMYNNILNPINAFVGINLLSLILMYGLSGLNNKLSTMIWFIVLIMFISYLIGVYLGTFTYRLSRKGKRKLKQTSQKKLTYLLILYCIIYNISAFSYIWKLFETFGFFSILSRMTEMNIAFQSGEFSVGILSIFLPMTYTILLLVLYYIKYYGGNILLYIQFFLCFIPAISPRRDTLFYLIFMSLVFMFLMPKRVRTNEDFKKYFKIFSVSSLGIWFMGFSQNLLNKSSEYQFSLFRFPIPASLNDLVIYIAGNYPYLQKLYDLGQVNFEYFLISTFRIIYIYVTPIFGLSVDATKMFDLPLYNLGNSCNFLFNTTPLVYYFIKESGIFFFIGFIILGLITQRLHNRFLSSKSAGNLLLVTYMYFLAFFSFRSYNLIYLSTVLILVYMLIAYFVVDVERD